MMDGIRTMSLGLQGGECKVLNISAALWCVKKYLCDPQCPSFFLILLNSPLLFCKSATIVCRKVSPLRQRAIQPEPHTIEKNMMLIVQAMRDRQHDRLHGMPKILVFTSRSCVDCALPPALTCLDTQTRCSQPEASRRPSHRDMPKDEAFVRFSSRIRVSDAARTRVPLFWRGVERGDAWPQGFFYRISVFYHF